MAAVLLFLWYMIPQLQDKKENIGVLGTGHKVQEGVGWKKGGGGPSFSCMKNGVGQEKSCNTLGVGHE